MRRIALFLAAAAASVLAVSCQRGKQAALPQPAPGVYYMTAEKRDVTRSFETIGQAVAEDSVNLVPQVTGYLVKRNFEEGSFVKKGDLLFEIDPRPYAAKVQQAQGTMLSAKSKVQNANIEYERQATLVRDSAVAVKNLDDATMNKGAAEGSELDAEGQLAEAKLNLEYCDILAPFDGKVGVCSVSVGNLVNSSTNLGTIVKFEPMKVEFNIPESMLVNAIEKHGTMASKASGIIPELTLSNGSAYPEKGELYFMNNVADSSTGTIMVRARFPNPKKLLRPGDYVKVSLSVKDKASAILVPELAVQRDMTGEILMIVGNDSKIERRLVKCGQRHGEMIEIASGLQVGERVVTEGLLKIRPGIQVEATPDPTTAPKAPKNGSEERPANAAADALANSAK